MVMGILFSIMINQKIIKEIGIKLIQEVLRKHYFQMLAMIQVKEIIDKVISSGKKLVFFKLLSHRVNNHFLFCFC